MIEDRSSHITGAEPDSDRAEGNDAPAADQGAPERVPSTTRPKSRSEVVGDGRPDAQKTVISKRPPVSPPAFRRASSPFEMGQILEGQQLGYFKLEEFVGGGGMGAVFRATDTMLGRTVAVKVVSRDQTDEDTLRRFRNEAQNAARLDHPNIARVYYVGEDSGWNYIVFEYIEGINVRDLVEQLGSLPLVDAINYTLQIAEALEHASRRDVIHRDIKPSNIVIMADGRAKLVDMGLARLHQVESSTNDVTASGVTLGTFDYISPEQASDPRNTDVRSDLYSLGCTFYCMLTGQPPFPDGNMLQKLVKHSSEPPPDPRQLRPDLPEEVVAILNKMLAKAPSKRQQSPRELIGELLALADHLDLSGIRRISTTWTAPPPPTRTAWERHLPWVVPTVTLLLAVVVIQLLSSSGDTIKFPPPKLITRQPTSGSAVKAPPAATVNESERESAGSQTSETPSDGAATQPPGSVANGSEDSTTSSDNEAPGKTTAPPGEATNDSPPSGVQPNHDQQRSPAGQPTQDAMVERANVRSNGSEAVTDQASSDPANDSAEETASPPKDPVPILVVTDEPIESRPGRQSVGTLEDAIRKAVLLDQASEIELRFNGPRFLQPVAFDLQRIPDQKLTIRAAKGYSPVLAFRPDPAAFSPDQQPIMIHVQGGYLTWENIQFYLELPPDAQPRNNWALFRLNDIERIDFRHCALTIRNTREDGTTLWDNVAFFEFPKPGVGDLWNGNRQPLIASTPTIWLGQSVARGQATLVRSKQAVPFLLWWDQGAFISTERLVETGGTSVEPSWAQSRVTLFLQGLLAVVDQGICLMSSKEDTPYQLRLATNCYDCLFVTRADDLPVPLYELQASTQLEEGEIPLEIGGEDNYYKNTKVVLRIEPTGGQNEVVLYTFDDLKVPGGQSWFKEKDPQRGIMFSWPAPSKPVDQQTCRDFMPSTAGENPDPIQRILGIDVAQLPEFQDVPPRRRASIALPEAAANEER